jgi:hypothetical protein
MTNSYKILVGNPERGDYVEDLGVDERIILKRISMEESMKLWTGFVGLRTEPTGGLV